MIAFNFFAANEINLEALHDVSCFVDTYPDFQTVTLGAEEGFKLLLELLGIEKYPFYKLPGSYFEGYWDLSDYKLPEFTKEEFNHFYEAWLSISGRENTMDEYGSLIFLNGLSKQWNAMTYRLVLKEL